MKCLLILLLTVAFPNPSQAQKHLAVLRASSNVLSIREGNSLYKDNWSASSKIKLDVFVTNHFKYKQRVVFYSDLDSLVFMVSPQRKYNFVVLLNNRDSAYTQISTYRQQTPTLTPKLVYTRATGKPAAADTIPFRLDKNFGIHLRGSVNGSDSLNFLFDTGAGAVVVTTSLIGKRIKLKLDGNTLNAGADGSQSVSTSSGNNVKIAGLIWDKVPLIAVDYKGFNFDMVLGWVAFENKVVEIDYENKRLIIRNTTGKIGPDYSKVAMRITGGIPYISGVLTANGRQSEGWFDLDTGSDGGLAISQSFASSNELTSGLKRIGSSESKGSAGVAFRQNIVVLPKLKLGEYELYQIPLSINEVDPVGGVAHENIGSSILKRFSIMLDFKNNAAYIKPNKFMYAPVIDKPAR